MGKHCILLTNKDYTVKMEYNDNFFVSLFSNDTANIYTENKISSFTNKMIHHFSLEGPWECALVECAFPAFDVSKSSSLVEQENPNSELLSDGEYSPEESMWDIDGPRKKREINEMIVINIPESFPYQFVVEKKDVRKLTLDEEGQHFQFSAFLNLLENKIEPTPPNDVTKLHIIEYAKIDLQQKLFKLENLWDMEYTGDKAYEDDMLAHIYLGSSRPDIFKFDFVEYPSLFDFAESCIKKISPDRRILKDIVNVFNKFFPRFDINYDKINTLGNDAFSLDLNDQITKDTITIEMVELGTEMKFDTKQIQKVDSVGFDWFISNLQKSIDTKVNPETEKDYTEIEKTILKQSVQNLFFDYFRSERDKEVLYQPMSNFDNTIKIGVPIWDFDINHEQQIGMVYLKTKRYFGVRDFLDNIFIQIDNHLRDRDSMIRTIQKFFDPSLGLKVNNEPDKSDLFFHTILKANVNILPESVADTIKQNPSEDEDLIEKNINNQKVFFTKDDEKNLIKKLPNFDQQFEISDSEHKLKKPGGDPSTLGKKQTEDQDVQSKKPQVEEKETQTDQKTGTGKEDSSSSILPQVIGTGAVLGVLGVGGVAAVTTVGTAGAGAAVVGSGAAVVDAAILGTASTGLSGLPTPSTPVPEITVPETPQSSVNSIGQSGKNVDDVAELDFDEPRMKIDDGSMTKQISPGTLMTNLVIPEKPSSDSDSEKENENNEFDDDEDLKNFLKSNFLNNPNLQPPTTPQKPIIAQPPIIPQTPIIAQPPIIPQTPIIAQPPITPPATKKPKLDVELIPPIKSSRLNTGISSYIFVYCDIIESHCVGNQRIKTLRILPITDDESMGFHRQFTTLEYYGINQNFFESISCLITDIEGKKIQFKDSTTPSYLLLHFRKRN